MSLKKTVAIAAAAGALAAISVPAMAFENEFHGTSRLRFFLSNYENGGGGNPLAPSATTGEVGLPAGNTTQHLKTNNYFEQRTRLFYTAKASDDLKLVTGFEIDSVFGDKAQGATTGAASPAGTGRNQGGALESDTVNLETKHVYLQFKVPSTPMTVTAGIQPFKDSIKGIFADFDAAGIMTSTKLGAATLNAGYMRGYDQSYFSTNRPRGMDNLNIGVLETKFAPTKNLGLTAAYYLYDDSRGDNLGNDIQLHVFGFGADAKVGPLSVSGFAAYQGGLIKGAYSNGDSAYLNALAYNVALKAAAGPGTFKTALLFTSGNGSAAGSANNHHYTGWVGVAQTQNNGNSYNAAGASTYNESGLMLLNRNAAAGTGTTDVALVYNPGNGTNVTTMQGVYLYSLGYDAKLGAKAYANVNAGMAWAAHTNSQKPVDQLTGQRNATNYMGTELNLEAGYKVYDNLTASLQTAYVFLGGFYKNSTALKITPEDPYTIRTSLIYNF